MNKVVSKDLYIANNIWKSNNINNHQVKANQSHKDLSFNCGKNRHCQKDEGNKVLVRVWGKRILAVLVEELPSKQIHGLSSKIEQPCNPALPLEVYNHFQTYHGTVSNIQTMNSTCPSVNEWIRKMNSCRLLQWVWAQKTLYEKKQCMQWKATSVFLTQSWNLKKSVS